MSKKKAIKIAAASAIAASAFAAVAPANADAAVNVKGLVDKAVKTMTKAQDTYAKSKSFVAASKVEPLLKQSVKDYNAAKAAVLKYSKGSTKTSYLAKLKAGQAKYYNAKAYVAAVKYAEKLSKEATALESAVAAKDIAAVKKAGSAKIAELNGAVAKIKKDVVGATPEKLVADKYLKKASSIANLVNVYFYADKAEYWIKKSELRTAQARLAVVDANLSKVSTTTAAGKVVHDYVEAVKAALNTGVEGVKAINATTVEVDFKNAINDIDNMNFTIDGLTVTNAVVKQTDSTVAVLTTSAQEGNKAYSVKVNGTTLGTFKGISAVVPTTISVATKSQQAVVGQQVVVKADIGVKAAGVPVTFNIDAANDSAAGSFNKDQVVEVFTNADGVAEYSYTQYAKGEDNVYAYATGNPNVRSLGKVYWGLTPRLTISEVTTGNELANGSKKVYKVSSPENANGYINVAFQENVDVSPDKLVRDVTVVDVAVGNNSYPYQVTTGGVQAVRVKLNANGEATFTVTGSNASVTPVVFADGTLSSTSVWSGNNKLEATELQAKAATVKFALNHTLGLDLKAEGSANAAAINAYAESVGATGNGGRKYTVTVTDKEGKLAPAGTKAYVTFAEGSYSTDKAAYLVNADGSNTAAVNKNTRFEITVGKEGKATFTLRGQRDAFAAPTVYLENGSLFGLDKADLQVVGETTYFVNAVVTNADLYVTDDADNEVSTLPSSKTANFVYQSVDQNGFNYFVGTGSYEVSYQVTAQFADVTVYGTFGSKVVKKGTTETVKVQSSAGKAVLRVDSENVASNVSVQASASQVSLPNKTASIAFTKGTQIPAVYTGNVASINPTTNSLTFAGYDAITYSTGSFKNQQGVVIDETAFETAVSAALANGSTVKVSAVQGADGKYVLEIESIVDPTDGTPATGTITAAVLSADATRLTLTFDKDLLASSVQLSDFVITDGSVEAVTSVSGKTVVLTVDPADVDASDVLDVDADDVTFADGTSNAAIADIDITQPVVNKLSALTTSQANVKAATEVLATGSVTVGAKTTTATVGTDEDQAAFNGLKITFVQDVDSADAQYASYNATRKEITVELGYVDTNNTLADVNAAIQALPAHGAIDFSEITLTGDALGFDDIATAKTITLANGVTAATPDVGVYTFTVTNNLTVGDVIRLNGKSYVAGTDFVVGSSASVTATNLAAAIDDTDDRFATVAAVSGVITLTDAVADGAAAPTLSIN